MGLLVPFPGRPLEVCGNAHPRWMVVQGAQAPQQNPAYQPARSPSEFRGPLLIESVADDGHPPTGSSYNLVAAFGPRH